jgi:hypothetical protein
MMKTMSSRSLPNGHVTELELQVQLEVARHFADQLEEFPASREIVKRLEQDISKIALAALTISNKPPQEKPIIADDGLEWHKNLELFDNTFICHRSLPNGMEYAIIEHFPSGANEIWTRGRSAVDVIKAFAHDQRRALEASMEDMAMQLKAFLAEKYPSQNVSEIAENLMRHFTSGKMPIQQNHEPRVRI